METTTERQKLQEIIQKLGDEGKLQKPTAEVKEMPNWYLKTIIRLKK